ncbi:MAG: hypothetical protein V4697_04250 [Patescibacteria group bacterium]
MKYYTTTSPALEGIIADDPMYFEGVERPSALYTIRDGGRTSEDTIEVLSQYFHDLHMLFLKKLSVFVSFENASGEEDSLKLQALFQELVKVKGLIEKGG